MAAIGTYRVDPERELPNHIIHKVGGVLLRVQAIDLERPYPRRIINRGILEPAQLLALGIDESEELDINLDVVSRHVFFVAMEARHASGALVARQDVHSMALENVIDASCSDLRAMVTLEIPGDARRAKVIDPAQTQDLLYLLLDFSGSSERARSRRAAGLPIDQPLVPELLEGPFPLIKRFPGYPKAAAGP